MKRSKVSLSTRFDKLSTIYKPKPLMGLMVGAAMLTGCGDDESALMYYTAEDCTAENPAHFALCRAAYEEAIEESARTAPKFSSLADCEEDFGMMNCTDVPSPYRQAGTYMPAMAGFMLAAAWFQDDDDFDIDLFKSRKKKRLMPLFTSYNTRSPFYGRRVGASGVDLGRLTDRRAKVSRSVFDRDVPTASRATSRGGFGRTVASSRSASRGG